MTSPEKVLTTNWIEHGRVWIDWIEYELGNLGLVICKFKALVWCCGVFFLIIYGNLAV